MRILRLPAALLVVNGLLLAPFWIVRGRVASPWFALEAGLVVGLMWILPKRPWTRWVTAVVATMLVLYAVVGLADAAARLSLARPLNLYLDIHLLSAVLNLLIGNLGFLPASSIVVASLAILGVAGWTIWALLLPRRADPSWPLSRHLGTALAVPAVVGIALAVVPHPTTPRFESFARQFERPVVHLVNQQVDALRTMLTERDRFTAELAALAGSVTDRQGLFGKLEGRDVIVAFIESYGVSAFEDPRYAPVVRPRLEDFALRMSESDLHVVTGTLTAPTQGGQSWFSHGSFLTGLWLDNQLRYDLMLASGADNLMDDFRSAGYRTVAVMPQITLAWPEGERLGYDDIFARKDIDYAGPPLNWVEMPDQFVWSYIEGTVRGTPESRTATGRRPVFAEIGLVSSHAPWTPILPVLDDWESIGDGRVFEPWENAGERPEELWLDTERVREHYALSVEYAIHAMVSYAERYVDEDVLLIVLGDHQPAPLITGDGASRAVPVHVISGDPALVEPFVEWGFRPGALPDPTRVAPGMDDFRPWFLEAFDDAEAAAPLGEARVAGSTSTPDLGVTNE